MSRAQRTGRLDEPCSEVDAPLTRVFALLGKRWNGLVLAVLTQGPAHFAQLRRAIPGISERVLSQRLAELAKTGLIVREVDPEPPLRVNYRVTQSGKALSPALRELGRWADEYLPGDTCGTGAG
nr:helix-turn-helix transcriptional regulator [Streptomyces sp. NBC_00830]